MYNKMKLICKEVATYFFFKLYKHLGEIRFILSLSVISTWVLELVQFLDHPVENIPFCTVVQDHMLMQYIQGGPKSCTFFNTPFRWNCSR